MARLALGRMRGAVLGKPALAHRTELGVVYSAPRESFGDERHGGQSDETEDDEEHAFAGAAAVAWSVERLCQFERPLVCTVVHKDAFCRGGSRNSAMGVAC